MRGYGHKQAGTVSEKPQLSEDPTAKEAHRIPKEIERGAYIEVVYLPCR